MKCSVNKDSPLYNPHVDTTRLQVLCEGLAINHVVEFDEEAGYAVLVANDDAGNVLVQGDRVLYYRLEGHITHEVTRPQ